MSQICSKIDTFLSSAYFGCHFCYHSNGKNQINTGLFLLGLYEEIGEKIFFYFLAHKGGGGAK